MSLKELISQLNTRDTITFNQTLHYIALSCGILSIGISCHFIYKFHQLRKTYLFQIAITIIFSALNLIFRFASNYMNYRLEWVAVSYNWSQFFSILCYQLLQCDLFKLVSVVSTFWNDSRIRVYKLMIVSLIVLGSVQFLLLRLVFVLGDGSFLDNWNRIVSPLALSISQVVILVIGIYMTMLMKSVCIIKDDKSKINYQKYLKYSYGLLILYNSLIVIGVLSYAIGVSVRGPDGTPNVYVYHGLACVGSISASGQVVALGFLFECIKAMKFGNDMERRQRNVLKRVSE